MIIRIFGTPKGRRYCPARSQHDDPMPRQFNTLFVTDDGREHALEIDLFGDVLRLDFFRLVGDVQVAVLHVLPAVLVHDQLQIRIVHAQNLLHELSLNFLVGDVDQVHDVWAGGGERKQGLVGRKSMDELRHTYSFECYDESLSRS